MKFEQLFFFYTLKLLKLQFLSNLVSNFFESISRTYFFSWKISNYADSFWFFYSNKKTMYELRYLKK